MTGGAADRGRRGAVGEPLEAEVVNAEGIEQAGLSTLRRVTSEAHADG